MFKIEPKFRELKKHWKIFFVSEIIAYENVTINCLFDEDNTYYLL